MSSEPTRTATAAAFAFFVLLGGVTAALGAALPVLRAEYGLAAGEGGSLIACYSFGGFTAIALCGLFAHRLPGPLVLRLSVVLFAAGCVGMGLADTWPVLVTAGAVTGLGYGGAVLHLNVAFAQRFDGVLMLNFLNAAFGAGTITGPLAVGWMPTITPAFPVIGVLALLCLPAGQAAPRHAPPPPSRHHLPAGLLAPFTLMVLLYAGLETGVGAWQATHLISQGLPPDTAVHWVSAFWAALALGRIVIPLVTRTQPLHRVVVYCLAAATAALAVATIPPLTPYAYTAAGLCLAPVIPVAVAWLTGRTPAAPQATAFLFAASMAGSTTLPLLVGILATPPTPALPIPLALTTIGAAALAAALATAHRHASPTPGFRR
ncbi:MFS transporter [Actinosynnema sp. NPDC047251]|uniref:Permease, MFS-type n=1 Tax=Saccharothrix espanaensis (strain ATCC 51144 / DSM 44229 / JCM 9112 / NBRC 15066 / NRRL 15764) TaxID=1179773 RepID=K0K2H6_SACES|nr:MFS transporter [Saccharothrix espanaensis]CCH32521.1 Permease, MFS-type [Saccharothrix espanaensis DSM 44229]